MRNYFKILTLLICTYTAQSQCDYEQNFNNPNDFEIIGDQILISNSSFNYIDLCPNASQMRAYKQLSNSISNQDCWTAQLKFNPQQVGTYQGLPYTGHLILSITETSMEPLSDCFDIECTGNPVSSQHSIVISYSATNPPDGNLHYKIIVNKEGVFDVSDLIINNVLDEEVFVQLEKICDNLVLTLFSDEDYSSMIQDSQVELSLENHRELNYIQHGNTAFGQIERELTGYIDDVCLTVNQCIYDTIQTDPIQICNGQSIEINGEVFNAEGTYQQTLTSSQGCDSILNLTIIEVQNIQASESFTFCQGETIEINGEVFNAEGTYQRTLISSQGCDSILNIELTILNQAVFVPNIYSASSKDNDLFKPFFSMNNQVNYNMSIYDRWGSLVFSGQNNYWDGRFNGKYVEQGVYVYLIYTDASCFENPIVGNVTFIK